MLRRVATVWRELEQQRSKQTSPHGPRQDNHLTHQTNFYRFRAPTLEVAGGVAYPGFDDFYEEGGVGDVIHFDIPHDNGATLDAMLNLASTYAPRIEFLQLATFNDFGEGTIFEPTLETGFGYLKKVQAFTGAPYGEDELKLVYRLYTARKRYASNEQAQSSLDEVADLLAALEITQATTLLDTVAPHGDFDGDGHVDGNDFGLLRQKFGTQTVLAGSGADANYDGTIDAADYVVWRKNVDAGVGAVRGVPEPTTGALLGFAAFSFCCRQMLDRQLLAPPSGRNVRIVRHD